MKRHLGAVLAVAVAIVLGTQQGAFAAWEGVDYGVKVSSAPGQTSFGTFAANGSGFGGVNQSTDDVYVEDKSADGQRVGLEWKTDTGRSGICVNKIGDN